MREGKRWVVSRAELAWFHLCCILIE